MRVFIGSLIEWVVDLVTDAWLVRKRRSLRNHPDTSWQSAARDVAYLDGLSLVLFALATAGVVILHFVLGLPQGISCLVAGAPVVIYCGYRWYRLLWG